MMPAIGAAGLPGDFVRYVTALAILVQRAGGTVDIPDYAASVRAVGELKAEYDATQDVLTITYKTRPRPDAWKWN